MAQKSGKTTKIDLYKFISPKGQVKDDSEGAQAGYALGSKTVQGINSLGQTLNGIAGVVTEIRDILKQNAAAQGKLLENIKPKRRDDNKTPAKKKKSSGITDFIVPVLGSFFEGLAQLAGFLFRTLVARGILKWLSDPKNLEKIEKIWNGIKSVAEFLYNFFTSSIFNMLDGIAKMWDPEATWWEKIIGFGQFLLGFGTLLLGLRWLTNPMKMVNDFIWVLKTLWTNLTNSKKRMKRGKWGRVLGAFTTLATVTAAGVVTYQVAKSLPDGTTPTTTEGNGANTKPGGVSLNQEHVIIAAGTNDYSDPKVGAKGVADAIKNVKEMGYKPVFIPPANEDRYKPVHAATVKAATDAGAIIEQGQYDPKDPLHPYTHILPSSMKSIQEKYNGAAVIGDSNAENAASPRFPHRGKSATVVADAVKTKLKPRNKDKEGVPEKAAGGWIHGPQSGYPVSLTGQGVDFIGHGTEYVAQKKAGGGFVVPFNTPATRNNPGLTNRRMGEAIRGGFDLGGMFKGFDGGGKFMSTMNEMSARIPGYASGGLLDFIASGEGGYNSMNQGTIGNSIVGSTHDAKSKVGKNLTDMTVGEVMERQAFLMNKANPQQGDYGIYAAGRYQIIPGTMRSIVSTMNIDKNAKFDKATQDKLGAGLIQFKKPYAWKYINKEHNDRRGAILALAEEWASIPHPDTGNTLYGSGNRAAHTVAQVEAAIDGARGGSPLVSDNPDLNIAGVPSSGSGGGDTTAAAAPVIDPEALKRQAFDMLAKGIDETRKVLGFTEEVAEEKESAEKTVQEEQTKKVEAATAVATAATKADAAKTSSDDKGTAPPPTTVNIPDNKMPDWLAFMPKIGLFGGGWG